MWLFLTVRPCDRGGGYTVEVINSLIGGKLIAWTRMVIEVLAESAFKRLKTLENVVPSAKSILEFESAHAAPVYLQ